MVNSYYIAIIFRWAHNLWQIDFIHRNFEKSVNRTYLIYYAYKQQAHLNSSGSHWRVRMFISRVLLALVTSVTWTPPAVPPVSLCERVWAVRSINLLSLPLTHISHVSTVPNIQVPLSIACLTTGTLSISQRNFRALKYGWIGRPVSS